MSQTTIKKGRRSALALVGGLAFTGALYLAVANLEIGALGLVGSLLLAAHEYA
jgi:hypothetical protein